MRWLQPLRARMSGWGLHHDGGAPPGRRSGELEQACRWRKGGDATTQRPVKGDFVGDPLPGGDEGSTKYMLAHEFGHFLGLEVGADGQHRSCFERRRRGCAVLVQAAETYAASLLRHRLRATATPIRTAPKKQCIAKSRVNPLL